MAFKKNWFSNKIVNSDGYSITVVDRATVLYEAESKIYVSAEMLALRNAWALYPSDMRMNSVHGPQLSDENLRRLIVQRIRSAFEFVRWRVEIA